MFHVEILNLSKNYSRFHRHLITDSQVSIRHKHRTVVAPGNQHWCLNKLQIRLTFRPFDILEIRKSSIQLLILLSLWYSLDTHNHHIIRRYKCPRVNMVVSYNVLQFQVALGFLQSWQESQTKAGGFSPLMTGGGH